ncbi:MAG: hypothetical protein WAK82_14250 [Streptosporangiaceae bacterium]
MLIVVAAWWHGCPGSLTKSRPGAGIVNTLIFTVAAPVLTGIAQVIVGKADFGDIPRGRHVPHVPVSSAVGCDDLPRDASRDLRLRSMAF